MRRVVGCGGRENKDNTPITQVFLIDIDEVGINLHQIAKEANDIFKFQGIGYVTDSLKV